MKRLIRQIISAHPLKPRFYVVSFGIVLFLAGSIIGITVATRSHLTSSANICIVGSSAEDGCDYHQAPPSDPTPTQQSSDPVVTPKQIELVPTATPLPVQNQSIPATPTPFKSQTPCN